MELIWLIKGDDNLNNKKEYTPIIFFIFTILFIIFDKLQFDLIMRINAFNLGLELINGILIRLTYFLYICISVWAVIYIFIKIRLLKWKAFIPLIIAIFTIIYVFVYPLTDMYLRKNFRNNIDNRIQVVKMIENKEIAEYQIGQDEYIVPYRSVSRTGTVLVQQRSGVTKVLFYIYKGMSMNKVLIYVSDNSSINTEDFNFGIPSNKQNFSNIKKIDSNWYYAIWQPNDNVQKY
jgi:hypothetical protein